MGRRAATAPLAVLFGAVLVSSCASGRAMQVQTGWTGEPGGRCSIHVDGRPIAERDFLAFARRWRGRKAHIRGDPRTPYRCVGGVIFELQRAGFREIGLISEPAPVADR